MNNFKNPMVAAASVLAAGFLLCAIIAGYSFYSIRAMDNQLSVTGSAKQEIKADSVKWLVTVSRPAYAYSLKTGYGQVASDLKIVKAFFANHGFAETELNVSTVFMDEVYSNTNPPPESKPYVLRQTIELSSKDVEKVSALSKNIQDIIDQGVILSAQAPNYSYSALADLRVSLLAAALKDAKARAESIAGMAGNKVGKLKSASSGVVQVLPVGSVEVSDYGSYDTSSIDKEVMVTVRASFSIK